MHQTLLDQIVAYRGQAVRGGSHDLGGLDRIEDRDRVLTGDLLGLLLYFICTKLILASLNLSLNAYQGIENMGKLSLAQIPELIVRTYSGYFRLAFSNYCNLSPNLLLKLSYGFLLIIHPIILVSASINKNKKKANRSTSSTAYLFFT